MNSEFEMEFDFESSSITDCTESEDKSAPEEQAFSWNWSKTDFEPHLFRFREENSGISPKIHGINGDTYFEFFELLFNEKRIDLIVKETNKYWEHLASDEVHIIHLRIE